MREARFKALLVPCHDVLEMLRTNKPSGRFYVPIFDGLPEGVEVVGVHHSFITNTFYFQLWHPTFDLVADGDEIPRLQKYPKCTMVEVREVEADELPLIVPA